MKYREYLCTLVTTALRLHTDLHSRQGSIQVLQNVHGSKAMKIEGALPIGDHWHHPSSCLPELPLHSLIPLQL